jgi:hypothetical protein
MPFTDDASGVGRSKTLAVAVLMGTIGIAGAGTAQAAPSTSERPNTIGTPATEDCWCDFDLDDRAYDDFAFADDGFANSPFSRRFTERSRDVGVRARPPGWRRAFPTGRFGFRARPGFRTRQGFRMRPGARQGMYRARPGMFRARGWFGAPGWQGRGAGAAYGSLSLESQVYTLTNGERDRERCPDLRLDYALSRAARNHSRDMAAYRYMSHTDYNNEDPAQRMERSGYPVRYGWAENIAYGSRTADQVMSAWMTSPGHRKNILDCTLRAIGVGVARAQDGTLFWTQNFGGR